MNQSIHHRFAVSMLLAGSAVVLLAAETITQAPPAVAATADAPATSKLPFATPLQWEATGILVAPVCNETHNSVSVKDPTIVRFESRWHIYATTANTQGNWSVFNNLDKFAWIGSYSAYLNHEIFDAYFGGLSAKPEIVNRQVKLLWLRVENEDFLYTQAVAFDELLKEIKIDHKTLFTGGGHTWMNARHYLDETLQLYFK